MPQLDILSYMTQVIWLFLILAAFYIILIKQVLPKLKQVMKVRSLVHFVEDQLRSTETKESSLISEILNQNKSLITQQTSLNQELVGLMVKRKNHVDLKKFNQSYLSNVTNLLLRRTDVH